MQQEVFIIFKRYVTLAKRLERPQYSDIQWHACIAIYLQMLRGELCVDGFSDIHFIDIVLGMYYL